MAITRQWKRCLADGTACVDLPGEIGSNYLLVSADEGKTLRCSKSDGVNTVISAATPVILPMGTTPDLGNSLPPRMPESSFIGESPGDPHTITVARNGNIAAAIAAASSGWVIFLRGGDWYDVGGNVGSHPGRWIIPHEKFSGSNPVTIMSYPGETAVLRGGRYVSGSANQESSFKFLDCDGFRFRNLTFGARNHTGIKLEQCYYFDFDSCVFRDSGRDMPCTGDATSPPSCGWGIALAVHGSGSHPGENLKSYNVQVWNCTWTNNGGNTYGLQGDIKHGHAMYLGGSGNSSIAGGGLDLFVIANNLAFDNPCGNTFQFGDAARNGFIVNNTVDNTDTRALHHTGDGRATDFSGAALDVWSASGVTRTQNIIIRNNSLTNSVGDAIAGSCSHDQIGILVGNNLAYHNAYSNDYGAQELAAGVADRLYGTHVLYHSVGGNYVGTAPGYKDTTGSWGVIADKDYSLNLGAYALGKADPAFSPLVDHDGTARPAAPAIGAFET